MKWLHKSDMFFRLSVDTSYCFSDYCYVVLLGLYQVYGGAGDITLQYY